MRATNADTIAKWQAEYVRANGKPAPDVFYHRGWFTIQLSKYRRVHLLGMIERLSKRPSAESAQ